MKKINGLWVILLAIVLFFLVTNVPALAGESSAERKFHRVPEASSRVKVDGVLDEKTWEEALFLELNYEVDPGENIKPPVKTEVLLVYGPRHLYVGFRAYDPDPSKIRAHVSDRDNIWGDDYVGIVLDTFNDSRRAYYFRSNPYGIQADHIISTIGGGELWDGIWSSAGKIDEKGYTVEMAIPYSTLRFQKKKGDQVWGIDATRTYPRNLNHSIGLFPRDRSNNCYLCQAHKAMGFKGADPGINLELTPTVSVILGQEREEFLEGKFVNTTRDLDPGLTARWSFTPNLTLSATINPDFSQVEADAPQLDVNNLFALYYPEKRPFFLEGASIFNTGRDTVYTRSIAEPEWGVKITGKEGGNAIGFYSVRDSITNLVFPGSQGSDETTLDLKNLSTALRYRRDIGKSSNLGVIITDREGKDYFNRVAGVDGDLRFTKRDRIRLQFQGSQTRYPDQVAEEFNQPKGKFSGSVFNIFYTHETRNLFFYGGYQDIKANFRADAGYISQADLVKIQGGIGYTWIRNPGHWFTNIKLESGYVYQMDQDKNLLDKKLYIWLTYVGPLHSYISVEGRIGKRTYLGREFDDTTIESSVELRPSGPLYLGLWSAVGNRIDYYNVRPGKLLVLVPTIQYNLGRRFFVGLDHQFERLDVEGGRLYTANITNTRLSYQFSRRIFLRLILQYIDYKYNTQLYTFPVVPRYRHLFSQVLFSYKINPRTVLFLGYSDDYYGFIDIPLKQNNRTFFMKIGYALVL
jgi:hypothetical protein